MYNVEYAQDMNNNWTGRLQDGATPSDAFQAGTGPSDGTPNPNDFYRGEKSEDYQLQLTIVFHIGCKEFDKKSFAQLKAWAESESSDHILWQTAVKTGIITRDGLKKLRAIAKKFSPAVESSLDAVNTRKL